MRKFLKYYRHEIKKENGPIDLAMEMSPPLGGSLRDKVELGNTPKSQLNVSESQWRFLIIAINFNLYSL
jgi:hypothetical protein